MDAAARTPPCKCGSGDVGGVVPLVDDDPGCLPLTGVSRAVWHVCGTPARYFNPRREPCGIASTWHRPTARRPGRRPRRYCNGPPGARRPGRRVIALREVVGYRTFRPTYEVGQVRASRIVAVLLTTVRPGSLELPAMITDRQLQVRRLVAEEGPYGFAVRTWDHSPPRGQRRYEAQPALRTTNYAGMEVSDCDAQSGRI
jgi:hypothetical protein